MSEWGTGDQNANRIKQTYVKGFLDISGGPLIVERSSSLQVIASDSNNPRIEFKPGAVFTVNTTSNFDVSYTALATLGLLGVSFEQSTADINSRVKYITTSATGSIFSTNIGNLNTNSDLTVYGRTFLNGDASFNGKLYVSNPVFFVSDFSLNGNAKLGSGSSIVAINKDISAGFALDVSGITVLRNNLYVLSDMSLTTKLFVGGDSSFNGNLAVGQDLSLNGNLYVSKRSLFTGDVSMNGNVRIGTGSQWVSLNKDISSGFALDVSGITMLRNNLYVLSDVSFTKKLFVGGDSSFNGNLAVGQDLSLNGNLYVAKRSLFTGDVSMNGNTRFGTGSQWVSLNKDISAGYALDVSGITVLRNNLFVLSDVSLTTKLFVGGDSSLNGNLAIGVDLSLNGNLYVSKRSLFTGDVSMNGNLDVGTGSSSVAINKDISSGYALDVSGITVLRNNLFVLSDVSFTKKLFVGGDFSLNGNLVVGVDLSLNGNLYVSKQALFTGDVSMNGNVRIGTGSQWVSLNKDISAGYTLDVSGITMLRNNLYVLSDVSFTKKLFVSGDSSLNGNLSVGVDLSLNGNLYVAKRSLFTGDVSMNGNTRHGTGSQWLSLNKDISAGYALDVSGITALRNNLFVLSDVSLTTKLFVGGDSSLNGNLSVGVDLSLNGNLYVSKRSLFTGDVSMNGNVRFGSGSQYISLNKDISAGIALDVSGVTQIRGNMDVSGIFTINGQAINGSGTIINLFVTMDSSMNGNLSVGKDLSLNGNLYVVKRSLFTGDVSMNGNTRFGTGSQWVSLNKDISAGYTLDVSGITVLRNNLFVLSDVSLTTKLFVGGDSSLNGNLAVGQDLSLNGNLYVSKRSLFTGDVSMNGNVRFGTGSQWLSLNKDISAGYALDVSGITALRNNLFVLSDVSLSTKLFVGGDSSLNGNLAVGQDLSLNGNLYVAKRSLFTGDVSMNGNTRHGTGSQWLSLNKDISAGYALDVSGITALRNNLFVLSDVSLTTKLFVGGDSSLNGNLSVGVDLSLNGNLYVSKRSVFTLDVSMNQNLDIGSGSNSVSINKDISSSFALDVSGATKFRGAMDVAGVFTVNGAPVSGGNSSLTGNVQVGSNSGFVTVDKPQFYADPSLIIYYNFDTSINAGTQIKNNATTSTLYDGSLNVTGASSTGMIDTTFKYGTASLKNNPATNNGVQILPVGTNIIPVSKSMTFSVWVNITVAPASTYRIFEFTDNTGGPTSDNNNIALDVNNSGIILPVLKNSNTSCITSISSPIITYTVINTGWNHISWVIDASKSYIYINGSIRHYDIITNSFPLTNRNSGFISYSYLGGNEYNGNIDEFRYYNGKALNYAEIYQLYNNNFYTLDICGGFLANGSSIIYEPSGSRATANSGTLTLLHGDASGSSSIMFKSVNDPLEYGYIQYEENAPGSTGYHFGLLTIGIENDAGTAAYTAQADRVSLFPSGGQGFVGVNTKTPFYSLDVSGILNTNADASINGVSIGRGPGNDATNTVVGYQALATSGPSGSVAVGYQALNKANTTSGNNDAFGYLALSNCTTGINNTAIGYTALKFVTTALHNTAIGRHAGNGDTGAPYVRQGNNNTFLGSYTGMTGGDWTNSTAVGSEAIITASYQIKLGTNSSSVYCGNNLLLQGDGTSSYIRNTTANPLYFGTETYNYMNISVQNFFLDISKFQKFFIDNIQLNFRQFITHFFSSIG